MFIVHLGRKRDNCAKFQLPMCCRSGETVMSEWVSVFRFYRFWAGNSFYSKTTSKGGIQSWPVFPDLSQWVFFAFIYLDNIQYKGWQKYNNYTFITAKLWPFLINTSHLTVCRRFSKIDYDFFNGFSMSVWCSIEDKSINLVVSLCQV